MDGHPVPEVRLLRLAARDGVPNNPDLPVVLMPGAVAAPEPERILARYAGSGWVGAWVWTVYDFHHYHPDAHEALTVGAGWAELQLGGASGPVLRLAAGDAVVLPAGTGHRRVAASGDFAMCGAYPPGQSGRTLSRPGDHGEGEARALIAAVPLPRTDPLFGADGPLVQTWGA
jgi:uncharacterized protein YjlB